MKLYLSEYNDHIHSPIHSSLRNMWACCAVLWSWVNRRPRNMCKQHSPHVFLLVNIIRCSFTFQDNALALKYSRTSWSEVCLMGNFPRPTTHNTAAESVWPSWNENTMDESRGFRRVMEWWMMVVYANKPTTRTHTHTHFKWLRVSELRECCYCGSPTIVWVLKIIVLYSGGVKWFNYLLW